MTISTTVKQSSYTVERQQRYDKLRKKHDEMESLWMQDKEIIEDLKQQGVKERNRLLGIKGLLIERTDQLIEAQEKLLKPVVKVPITITVSNEAVKYEKIVAAYRDILTPRSYSEGNEMMAFISAIKKIIGDDVKVQKVVDSDRFGVPGVAGELDEVKPC